MTPATLFRHLASLWAALVCLTPLAGSAADIDLPPTHVLAPDKRTADERLPLLLYLHGLGGSGADAVENPVLTAVVKRERMFVVAPDGTMDGQGRRFWNAGASCCNFDRTPIDDVARLTALVDHWRSRPEIDPRRIYVVGFSNGGFMAHLLGCRIGERLAAVVSIAGAGPDPKQPCSPKSPLAVLEIHGDDDRIVRFEGGRVFDNADLAVHPSATQTIRAWVERLGCGAKPVQKEVRGSRTVVEATRGCALGSAELWTVRGGGHNLGTVEILEQLASFLTAQNKPSSTRPKRATARVVR